MNRMRGFTLMECFLAIVLVASVFFALASIFPVSLGSLRKSQTRVMASNLGRQTMEIWKAKPFKTLETAAPPPFTVQPDLEGPVYTEAITVLLTPDANVLQLQVLVTWDSGGTCGPGSLSYSTQVFNVANPW